jgi:hypothetical protein
MRVLVTGSKLLCDQSVLRSILHSIKRKHKTMEIITIQPYGAGMIAAEWAKSNRVKVVERQLPTWKLDTAKFGEEFRKRNAELIQEHRPDLILSYQGNGISCDIVRQAKRAGIEVREIA